MKPTNSNTLNSVADGVTTLQVGQFSEVHPAACGQVLLAAAGLNTLEDTKNAFVGDPGTAVSVTPTAHPKGFEIDGSHKGWLVVDGRGGDFRGTVHQSFAGAAAQVWAIVSTQDAGTVTMADPTTKNTPVFAFDGVGPLGMTTLVMTNISENN